MGFKFCKLKFIFLLYCILYNNITYPQNSIKFYTEGQQYGVADLDYFLLSPSKDYNNCYKREAETPDEYTVGRPKPKPGASNGFVWGDFGCGSNSPWPKKSGYVKYNNIPCDGKTYLNIIFYKNSSSSVSIEIFIHDIKQTEFIPEDQGSWESITESGWIPVEFPTKDSIEIVFPNGGEFLPIGTEQSIIWSYSGEKQNVQIELTRDAGISWETLVQNISADSLICPWLVTSPTGNKNIIKISDIDSNVLDISDSYFSIIDTIKLSLNILWKSSFNVFQFLRNDIGVYADAARFSPPQFHPASVASIGMGLITLCITHELDYIQNAESLVIQTLNAMFGKQDGFIPERNNFNGFYRHWIDPRTGKRAWDSEFSSIDTGILISGALFCKKYFKDNNEIEKLADSLYLSVDWSSAIANAESGEIYLTFDENGNGIATTKPFNEYMIVAWLAKNDSRNNHKAIELWNKYYATTTNLPKSIYEGIEVLTDRPGHFLSNFVIQFPYYLCHYFTQNDEYLHYFRNAMLSDKHYWNNLRKSDTTLANYIWGTGAGASLVASGYHPDNIKDNPGTICSPHIIAGFIPVNPEGINDLFKIWIDSVGIYQLPDSLQPIILWRFSIDSLTWKANDVQGVDYSTMLFGLASHSQVLGSDFFKYYNNFDFPLGTSIIKNNSKENINGSKNVELKPSYPNPFNLSTKISIQVKEAGKIELNIYNLRGQVVRNIVSSELDSGNYNYQWDGKDFYGKSAPSGVYFLQLNFNNRNIEKRKLLLLR